MRNDWDVSIRRACRAFLCDTSNYHHKSPRPGQAHLEQRIREICQIRVRYGYRVHVLMRREGCRHGQDKIRRIYRELGLNCAPNAQAPCESKAARRSAAGDAIERALGDGLRA